MEQVKKRVHCTNHIHNSFIIASFRLDKFKELTINPDQNFTNALQNAVKFEDKRTLFSDLKRDAKIVVDDLPSDILGVQNLK